MCSICCVIIVRKEIGRFLGFDNFENRAERRLESYRFGDNCKKNHNSPADLCPDKYGSENLYALNLQIYAGMTDGVPEKHQGRRVLKDLVSHLGQGYRITTDNFLTSLNLARKLLEHNKTLKGTIVVGSLKTSYQIEREK